MTGQDLLLLYAIGLDAGNFNQIEAVIHLAEIDDTLYEAMMGLHARFDSNESFTRQLLQLREAEQGGANE